MEMVPESRSRLLKFLSDQSKEISDFVKETDEKRFIGVTESVTESSDSDMDTTVDDDDHPSDNISEISEISIASQISGISEIFDM